MANPATVSALVTPTERSRVSKSHAINSITYLQT